MMKQTINLTAMEDDLARFADRDALREFYKEKGLDGIELMLCGAEQLPDKIPPEDVLGIHLHACTSWLDFWNGNEEALDREYGAKTVWTEMYGGSELEALLLAWERELETAHRLGVSYVVFHVSECTLEECVTYRQCHTDEEICDAACQIINRLLDGKPYQFQFLCENLWWGGLTMTRPEIVERLMDGIRYEHKGIMLDTGHLMHTNNDLQTEEEGVAYIHRVLDRCGSLCRFIKGVHLHQSLTGAYVKDSLAHPRLLTGSYEERFAQVYWHILQIDQHKPVTSAQAASVLSRLSPDFVTHELITRSQEEHENALRLQLKTLKAAGYGA